MLLNLEHPNIDLSAYVASTSLTGGGAEICRQIPGGPISAKRALWQNDLKKKFASIAALRDGWDGLGSLAPSASIRAAVSQLLFDILESVQRPLPPYVVPMADGGLQVEWHRKDAELEVAFFADGSVTALFEDLVDGTEIEAEHAEARDLFLRYAPRVAQDIGNDADVQTPPTVAFVSISG